MHDMTRGRWWPWALMSCSGILVTEPWTAQAAQPPHAERPLKVTVQSDSETPEASLNRLRDQAGTNARIRQSKNQRTLFATRLKLDLSSDPAWRSGDNPLEQLVRAFPALLGADAGYSVEDRRLLGGEGKAGATSFPVEVWQRRWRWQGLLLEGSTLTLHVDARGRIVAISAVSLPPIEPPRGGWSSPENVESTLNSILQNIDNNLFRDIGPRKELRLMEGAAHPVWTVVMQDSSGARRWILTLDGETGTLLRVEPGGASLAGQSVPQESAGALVYRDSPEDGSLADLPLTALTSASSLTGDWATVYNYVYKNGRPPGAQVPLATPTETSPALRYDFPPIEEYTSSGPTEETQTDLFAEPMMYFHVTRAHEFFSELGYENADPLRGIDRSMSATVNYRPLEPGYFNNAYYSLSSGGTPGQIIFGQGQETDFSYDASVIYHEYTHAVVDGSSQYALSCVPDTLGSDCTQGGLNEGSADYFSASLRDDSLIGAYAMGHWLPEYVRDLEDEKKCPDDLYGEEHEDGRIWAGALWALRNKVAASDPDSASAQVDPVLLPAILTPLPPAEGSSSAFAQAAELVLTDALAAVESGAWTTPMLEDAVGALQDRGVVGCERIVPLHTGISQQGAFSTSSRPFASQAWAGQQYKATPPLEAVLMTFEVRDLEDVTIYGRKGAPVEINVDTGEVTADWSEVGTSVTVTTGGDPALEPGADYYFLFSSSQTLATALYGFYYSVQYRAQDEDGEQVGTFDPDDSGGCSCDVQGRQGGTGGGLLWWGFGGAFFALRRARARQVSRAPGSLSDTQASE